MTYLRYLLILTLLNLALSPAHAKIHSIEDNSEAIIQKPTDVTETYWVPKKSNLKSVDLLGNTNPTQGQTDLPSKKFNPSDAPR
jgi:hypothetical protein